MTPFPKHTFNVLHQWKRTNAGAPVPWQNIDRNKYIAPSSLPLFALGAVHPTVHHATPSPATLPAHTAEATPVSTVKSTSPSTIPNISAPLPPTSNHTPSSMVLSPPPTTMPLQTASPGTQISKGYPAPRNNGKGKEVEIGDRDSLGPSLSKH
jgi:hypothetical protein